MLLQDIWQIFTNNDLFAVGYQPNNVPEIRKWWPSGVIAMYTRALLPFLKDSPINLNLKPDHTDWRVWVSCFLCTYHIWQLLQLEIKIYALMRTLYVCIYEICSLIATGIPVFVPCWLTNCYSTGCALCRWFVGYRKVTEQWEGRKWSLRH